MRQHRSFATTETRIETPGQSVLAAWQGRLHQAIRGARQQHSLAFSPSQLIDAELSPILQSNQNQSIGVVDTGATVDRLCRATIPVPGKLTTFGLSKHRTGHSQGPKDLPSHELLIRNIRYSLSDGRSGNEAGVAVVRRSSGR